MTIVKIDFFEIELTLLLSVFFTKDNKINVENIQKIFVGPKCPRSYSKNILEDRLNTYKKHLGNYKIIISFLKLNVRFQIE